MSKKKQIRSLVVGGAVVATFAILLVIYQPFSGLIINRPYRSLNLIKGLRMIKLEISRNAPSKWECYGGQGEIYLSPLEFEATKTKAAAELPLHGYKLTRSGKNFVWWEQSHVLVAILLDDGSLYRFGVGKGRTTIECASPLPNSLLTKARLALGPD